MIMDIAGTEWFPSAETYYNIDVHFHRADINHDGYMSVDEFYLYYYSNLILE